MSGRIRLQDYRHMFPEIGGMVRVNHDNCPAGEDTKRRLYISRPEEGNGLVIAYCHNCGSNGVISRYQHSFRSAHHTNRASNDQKESTFREKGTLIRYEDVFKDTQIDTNSLIHAKPYGFKNDDPILSALPIFYDPSTNRACMHIYDEMEYTHPYWTSKGELYGYNLRALYDTQFPKYKLEVSKNFRGWTVCLNSSSVNKVVIVEDQISACVLAMQGYTGVCLYSANSTIEKIHNIYARFKDSDPIYTVWLDNDSELIKEKAVNASKYLKLMGAQSNVCLNHREPKYYYSLPDKLDKIIKEATGV